MEYASVGYFRSPGAGKQKIIHAPEMRSLLLSELESLRAELEAADYRSKQDGEEIQSLRVENAEMCAELESLRVVNVELRESVDWKRKSLEQEIVGTLRAYGHWCPDSGADVITAVGLALDALRWRPVSEPPEDEEEYVEVVDERLSIELRPWWTVAVDLEEGNHSWTHYRRFVAPGEA